ncbi:DUF4365 domain-containing protein [Flavobacterium sp. WW92]|uniref:DUF4365 domain-containing protein n=1 Tax=unclassified Flavobacterium TaxID=196869 RepID=UPI0022252CE3|nr:MULTISPECIES: DUF4365 domain-containing protein [unclassified Flavobacterium]WDO12379.1 DUF4365 domain-containing protein [Flavobacterium sp. WW92]
MIYNNFEDANLPKVNTNESLETLSENLLKSLFPAERFEIRAETQRDKGIDFHIELKMALSSGGWGYTNYRFAVQLKATNTIQKAADGSYGMQLFSSNINYLLNNGMPAYYIFYHHPTQSFYYENVRNFVKQLQGKNPDWHKKEKHKLYFSKKLDQQSILEIYEETYANGNVFKHVSNYLKFPDARDSSNALVIDPDNRVHSVAENIEFIDQFGADLVNRHHFNTIIELEKRSWPRNGATPRFYLFCGIAYFQRGNLYKALELLNDAKKHSNEFDNQGQAIIAHTILSARYLLDMITKEQYDLEMAKINSIEESGSFFQIERAFEELASNRMHPAKSIVTFYDSMSEIIENEKSAVIRTVAYNKIIDAESTVLYHDLVTNFTYFVGRVEDPFQSRAYREWLELEKKFLARLDAIAEYADKCGHHIGVGNLTLTSVKWNYEKAFHMHYLACWKGRNFDMLVPVDEEMVRMLQKQCASLDRLAELYGSMEYTENMISCMVLKFQILHFSRLYEDAQLVKDRIFEVLNSFGFEGLRKQYDSLFQNGTAHERFVEGYTQHMNRIQDFATKNGIDWFRMLSEEEMNSRTAWSIKEFLELDFTVPSYSNIAE